MAGAAAEIFVRIAADVTSYQNTIRNLPLPFQGATPAITAAASGLGQIERAATEAAGGLRLTAGAMDHVHDAAGHAAGGVSRLGGAFAANLAADLVSSALQMASGAMLDAGKSAIVMAGELEQSKVAFTTMLGSAEKADAFLRRLTAFAASTPFELRGLQDSSKRLLAFGFQAKDIIPIMTGVGNAVAGLGGGKATLDGVTLALGQMAAKGRASAEEMNQLAERGIPAWEIVASKIGKSIPEAMKMAEKGMISGATAVEALVNGMNERFPSMMAKQSKTLLGAWSNLHDGIDRVLTNIGTRIIDTFNVKEAVTAAGTAFAGLARSLESDDFEGIFTAAKAAALGFGTAVTVAVAPAVYTAVVGTMIPAVHALALAWAPAIAAALPFVGLAAAVAFAAVPIMNQWDDLKITMRDVWGVVAQSAADAWKWVRQVYDRMADGAASLARSIASWLGGVFGGLGQELQAQMNNLPAPVRDALGKLGGLFQGFRVEATGHLVQLGGELGNVAGQVGAAAMAAGRTISDNLAYSWGGIGDSMRAVMDNVLGNVAITTDKVGDLVLAGSKKIEEAAKKLKKAPMSEAAKDARAAKEAFENLAETLRILNERIAKAHQFGELEQEIKSTTEKVSALDSALKTLAKKHQQGTGMFKETLAELVQTVGELDILKRRLAEVNNTAKALAAYNKVYDDFAASMSGIAIEAGAIGPSFNRVAAEADALKKQLAALIDLKKGGLLISPLEIEAVAKKFAVATQAVEDYQKKLDATKAIKDFEEGTAQIQRRLTNLGPAFVGAGEQADLARRAWEQAGGMAGMSAEQVETLRAKADEASLAAGRGGLAFEAYTTATNNAGQAIANLRAGLAGIGEAIGLELNDPVTAAAANAVGLAMSLGQVAEAAPHVVDAVGKLSGEISTLMGSAQAGPFALAAAAAVAVGVALYKMGEDTSKVRARYDADIEAIAEETVKKADQMSDGWYRVGQDIMRIARGIRAAWDWMTGPTDEARRKMDELAQQMQQSRDQAKALTEAYNTLGDSIRTGVEGATKSAIKAFMSGAGSMTSLLRDGIRNAIVDGMIEATLQKGLIQKQFGGLIDSIAIAATDGRNGEVERLIGQLGSQIPQVARQLESTFGTLKATLNKAFDPIQGIMDARGKAYEDAQWQANTLGSTDAAGLLKAKAAADEKALEALRDAGLGSSGAFQDILATLGKNRSALAAAEEAAKAAAKAAKDDGKDSAKALEAQQKAIREAYQGSFDVINAKLTQVANNSGTGSSEGQGLIAQLAKVRAEMDAAMRAAAASVPALAAGGVTTGPALALIGEGRHREAVLPLSADTYRAIAAGIASESRGAPASSGQVNIYITNTGKGRWTDQDAEELGAKIVTRLKREGVRV